MSETEPKSLTESKDEELNSGSSSEEEFMDCDNKTETMANANNSAGGPLAIAMGYLGFGGGADKNEDEPDNGNPKTVWAKVKSFSDSNTVPQVLPLSSNQVRNNAGGFVYAVSDRVRIRRFLILGTSGGTYYVKEQELTLENVKEIIEMIKNGKGDDILLELYEINKANRAPKHTPLIFCLALVARFTDESFTNGSAFRAQAYKLLPAVCRIPTHLFQFADFSEKASGGKSSGWGRAHRNAIASWYLEKDPMALAMAITKYQQRGGWSHRDLLRLSHPKTDGQGNDTTVHDDLFMYCTKGYNGMLERRQEYLAPATDAGAVEGVKKLKDDAPKHLKFLEAVEVMKKCTDENAAATLIEKFNLVREHVPTELLSSKIVWRALLKRMPMTAMIRNLGKMTNIDLLMNKSDEAKLVCEKLNDVAALHAARIHPLNVLLALAVYRSGAGDKGKLTWNPNQNIVGALNEAFHKSFANVEPTNKRFLLALDVSGSMGASLSGSSLSCKEASGAMAMVTLRTEPLCEVVAFQDKLTELKLNKDMKLDQVLKVISGLPFGSTDCALPMLWAAQRKKKFDCFIVFTDNETYFGSVHPAEAMRQYRLKSGIWDAKLIVVGMTATKFTIADPNDPFMLDIVGFDSSAPELIRNFVLGWDAAPKPTNFEPQNNLNENENDV